VKDIAKFDAVDVLEPPQHRGHHLAHIRSRLDENVRPIARGVFAHDTTLDGGWRDAAAIVKTGACHEILQPAPHAVVQIEESPAKRDGHGRVPGAGCCRYPSDFSLPMYSDRCSAPARRASLPSSPGCHRLRAHRRHGRW